MLKLGIVYNTKTAPAVSLAYDLSRLCENLWTETLANPDIFFKRIQSLYVSYLYRS